MIGIHFNRRKVNYLLPVSFCVFLDSLAFCNFPCQLFCWLYRMVNWSDWELTLSSDCTIALRTLRTLKIVFRNLTSEIKEDDITLFFGHYPSSTVRQQQVCGCQPFHDNSSDCLQMHSFLSFYTILFKSICPEGHALTKKPRIEPGISDGWYDFYEAFYY